MATVTNLFEQRERKVVQLARGLWATRGGSDDLFEQLRAELARLSQGTDAGETFSRARAALGSDTQELVQYSWALGAALSSKIEPQASWTCLGIAVRVPASEASSTKVRSLKLSTQICSALENLVRESFGSHKVSVSPFVYTVADIMHATRAELVAFGDETLESGAVSSESLRHEYDSHVPDAPVSGSTICRANATLMVLAVVSGPGTPRNGLLASRSVDMSSALKAVAAAGVLEAMRGRGYAGSPDRVKGVAASSLHQAIQGGEESLVNMFLMGLRTRNARLGGLVVAKHSRTDDGSLQVDCLKHGAVVERYLIRDRVQACGMSTNLGNLADAIEKIPFDVFAPSRASNEATV